MLKIAVASGKGGTGKTTVSTSLALALSQSLEGPDVQFLDCDVEEPNAAIFLNPDIRKTEQAGVPVPEIDLDKCTYCGRCAEVCVWNAIAVAGEHVLTFPEMCHGCGSCGLVCPESAITEVLNVTGKVESGKTEDMSFAHGLLNVGQAMPVPVISKLKTLIGCDDEKRKVVILDSPPGTACAMVAAVSESDFVLMVTEPTPFGLHDLEMAVNVVRGELGIPVGVVINRDGTGFDGVENYCEAENIPVLMRIPLSRRIAEALSDGIPLVKAFPEYMTRFTALFDEILQRVRV
jgi:MinD superfamily P-loop ATPase